MHFYADIANATIEFVGGLLIWLHVRRLLIDRAVLGVSLPPLLFFCAWGWFNVIYYPIIGQYVSGAVAFMPAVANTVWIVLILRFKNAATR